MQSYDHLMIDLETFGTASNSVILSIGAVEFNKTGLGKEFHVHIDPQSCVDAGLTMDASTVLWWMTQSEEARTKIAEADRNNLFAVLNNFVAAFDWRNKKVWGNGASFDIVIMENAMKAVNVAVPWKFWNQRCFRTLKSELPVGLVKEMTVRPELAHDALSDAKAQALTAINLLKAIQG